MQNLTYGLVAIFLFILIPASASAELYIYTDKNGIVHITNIPNNVPEDVLSETKEQPNKETKKVTKTENTFNWKDNLGVLRRVHKVGVTKFDDLIKKAAKYYTLPPSLIKAVIAVESCFEPNAVSPAGAEGLMQLIPPTAKEMEVVDSMNPEQNIFGGTRYIRILANHFKGDLRLTLAAYNAGPKAVERSGSVPNYAETKEYVKRVIKLYRHYLKEKDPQ